VALYIVDPIFGSRDQMMLRVFLAGELIIPPKPMNPLDA
jgi:hypothetical protein